MSALSPGAWDGKRVLITGASGFIGSALTERLLDLGARVSCQSRSRRSSVRAEEWMEFDLIDAKDSLRDVPGWDAVFHVAGQTSIAAARDDPMAALRDNVMGFAHLLDALRAHSQAPLVIFAGTVTQVGLTESPELTEDLTDHPVTFYDVTKLMAELLLMQYVREGWLAGCSLRLATVYGAVGPGRASDRGIIDRVFQQALDGRPLSVFGTGQYLRDYIHISDVVDAFLAAGTYRERVNGRTFLIGSGKGIYLLDAFRCAAELAEELTGQKVPIYEVDPPEGLSAIDFRSAVVASRSFTDATGWEPRYELSTGLRSSYGAG